MALLVFRRSKDNAFTMQKFAYEGLSIRAMTTWTNNYYNAIVVPIKDVQSALKKAKVIQGVSPLLKVDFQTTLQCNSCAYKGRSIHSQECQSHSGSVVTFGSGLSNNITM